MKAGLILSVLLILGLLLGKSFLFPNHIVLHFENNSKKVIDSVIIHIQNHKLKLFNVQPYTNVTRKVPKDSIVLNNHDITVRTLILDKKGSNFKDGFYHEDLSGLRNRSYVITVNADLSTLIR